ncbi:multicopper oxidase domain-containing protein [Dactylosporangium sp. NPDC051485]|uniref:multicopper oxidase domain-containing protein n=1 Tax=Dactylosporangium sp. NPDC051485 TaxID=3154846 RepID=UPI003443B5C0
MDTFDVQPGEVWEVALRVDNPGVWMHHRHNLKHAGYSVPANGADVNRTNLRDVDEVVAGRRGSAAGSSAGRCATRANQKRDPSRRRNRV